MPFTVKADICNDFLAIKLSMNTKLRTLLAFCLITSLFFLWGFAHNPDPILIPHLKKSFTLTTTQATLVDSTVFLAFFLMALPAVLLMKKPGYKVPSGKYQPSLHLLYKL